MSCVVFQGDIIAKLVASNPSEVHAQCQDSQAITTASGSLCNQVQAGGLCGHVTFCNLTCGVCELSCSQTPEGCPLPWLLQALKGAIAAHILTATALALASTQLLRMLTPPRSHWPCSRESDGLGFDSAQQRTHCCPSRGWCMTHLVIEVAHCYSQWEWRTHRTSATSSFFQFFFFSDFSAQKKSPLFFLFFKKTKQNKKMAVPPTGNWIRDDQLWLLLFRTELDRVCELIHDGRLYRDGNLIRDDFVADLLVDLVADREFCDGFQTVDDAFRLAFTSPWSYTCTVAVAIGAAAVTCADRKHTKYEFYFCCWCFGMVGVVLYMRLLYSAYRASYTFWPPEWLGPFWLEADPNAPSSFNATDAEFAELLERGFELLWDDPEGSTFVVSIVAIVTSIVFRIVTTFLWIPHCASRLSRAYAAKGSRGSRRGEVDSSSELQPEPEPEP